MDVFSVLRRGLAAVEQLLGAKRSRDGAPQAPAPAEDQARAKRARTEPPAAATTPAAAAASSARDRYAQLLNGQVAGTPQAPVAFSHGVPSTSRYVPPHKRGRTPAQPPPAATSARRAAAAAAPPPVLGSQAAFAWALRSSLAGAAAGYAAPAAAAAVVPPSPATSLMSASARSLSLSSSVVFAPLLHAAGPSAAEARALRSLGSLRAAAEARTRTLSGADVGAAAAALRRSGGPLPRAAGAGAADVASLFGGSGFSFAGRSSPDAAAAANDGDGADSIGHRVALASGLLSSMAEPGERRVRDTAAFVDRMLGIHAPAPAPAAVALAPAVGAAAAQASPAVGASAQRLPRDDPRERGSLSLSEDEGTEEEEGGDDTDDEEAEDGGDAFADGGAGAMFAEEEEDEDFYHGDDDDGEEEEEEDGEEDDADADDEEGDDGGGGVEVVDLVTTSEEEGDGEGGDAAVNTSSISKVHDDGVVEILDSSDEEEGGGGAPSSSSSSAAAAAAAAAVPEWLNPALPVPGVGPNGRPARHIACCRDPRLSAGDKQLLSRLIFPRAHELRAGGRRGAWGAASDDNDGNSSTDGEGGDGADAPGVYPDDSDSSSGSDGGSDAGGGGDDDDVYSGGSPHAPVAFPPGWDVKRIVGRAGAETVSLELLQCLHDGGWLNDEVLNFGLHAALLGCAAAARATDAAAGVLWSRGAGSSSSSSSSAAAAAASQPQPPAFTPRPACEPEGLPLPTARQPPSPSGPRAGPPLLGPTGLLRRGRVRAFCFNTFFVSGQLGKAAGGGYAYHDGITAWCARSAATTGVAPLEADVVLFPLHLGVHWALAGLDVRGRALHVWDSMAAGYDWRVDAMRVRPKLGAIAAWLGDHAAAVLGDAARAGWDARGWPVHRHVDGVPQQGNGCDCGAFMLGWAQRILRGQRGFKGVTQRHMPYLRRRLALDIAAAGSGAVPPQPAR